MVRSLPVPLAVLTRVWPDPAWQAALRDRVVTGADGQIAGFLRDAGPARSPLSLGRPFGIRYRGPVRAGTEPT
ncbi:hypothetical protein M878_39470 [Streptomyces roseochromogenus subsp. oscitans DS 12.976]|uniref:Uncharacterized protein n=1 Tax=Streptomyces roseochromogenus subsp. oscitans DS 12.976 TaxID=1352936 RepID=V6JLE6_STRRC|nr:hypothetical protein M878_39470 [Streptomyces roseochromogenus subsp. oscitans DS 12.976]